jgi:hypothetical protein
VKRIACFAAIALLAASCDALSMGEFAEVTVIDRDDGARLPLHYYHGEYWVAGRPGARYAIEIRNRIGERVLAVTSVDGVNVISGDTASWNQAGYVLNAGERYKITGWRKSDSEVAAFTFTASPNSYAARTGRSGNIGVIGVAFFRERQPYAREQSARSEMDSVTVGSTRLQPSDLMTPSPVAAPAPENPDSAPPSPPIAGSSVADTKLAAEPTRAPMATAASAPTAASAATASPMATAASTAKAAPAPAAAAYPPAGDRATSSGRSSAPAFAELAASPKLGTGHGAREASFVFNVEFERLQQQPNEVIRIRYDSLDNLVAMGIIERPHSIVPAADPFPGSPEPGYVPDPPGGS